MDFMAMAGLNVTEIMDGLPGVLNLAQAGNLDLATSADIATNIMGQFNKEATDLNHIVDVMAKTATSSNTNVQEMGEAMNYLGPTMNALGVSIEETSAVIGILANNGIKGSLAGRALGTSLVRLANPTVYEKTKVVGIIISKDSETTCRVQWSGETPSLFNNLQVGSIYFLGLDGKPTNPPPLPSETQDIFVNPIGVASDYDKIYIKPSMLITKRIGG
jgi:hypothetical protein